MRVVSRQHCTRTPIIPRTHTHAHTDTRRHTAPRRHRRRLPPHKQSTTKIWSHDDTVSGGSRALLGVRVGMRWRSTALRHRRVDGQNLVVGLPHAATHRARTDKHNHDTEHTQRRRTARGVCALRHRATWRVGEKKLRKKNWERWGDDVRAHHTPCCASQHTHRQVQLRRRTRLAHTSDTARRRCCAIAQRANKKKYDERPPDDEQTRSARRRRR